MVPQFCFSWMSGMIIYFKTSSQDCFHLLGTRLYQWLNSSSITTLNNNFIYHCRYMHSKNIRICNKLSSKSRLQTKAKTIGITFGGTLHTHLLNSVIYHTKIYNLPGHLYGYGTPNVLIKSRSSNGYC
jgi:hypothetical protein